MNQQTAATENALSGERTHRTFSIPITGDEELDFMSALVAITNEMLVSRLDPQRVLQWFFQRTENIHKLPVRLAPTQPGWPGETIQATPPPWNTGTIGSPTTSPPYAQMVTTACIAAFGNSTVGLANSTADQYVALAKHHRDQLAAERAVNLAAVKHDFTPATPGDPDY